jgi:hypothetical protein
MSAFDQRRVVDVEKLQQLAEQSRKRVGITRVVGKPQDILGLRPVARYGERYGEAMAARQFGRT